MRAKNQSSRKGHYKKNFLFVKLLPPFQRRAGQNRVTVVAGRPPLPSGSRAELRRGSEPRPNLYPFRMAPGEPARTGRRFLPPGDSPDSGFPWGKRPDGSRRRGRGGRRNVFSWVPLDRTHPVFPPVGRGGPGRAGTGTEAGSGEKSGRADTEGGFGIARSRGVPARAGTARQLPPSFRNIPKFKNPPPGVLISMLEVESISMVIEKK